MSWMEARDGGAEVWKARRAGSELLTAEKRYTSRGGGTRFIVFGNSLVLK